MITRSKVKIEQFEKDDLEQVLKLWNISLKNQKYFYPMSHERFETAILKNKNFDPKGCLVARSNSKIVGFGLGVIRSEKVFMTDIENLPGFISVLLVHPAFRGQGIGTSILEAIEKFLCEKGKKVSQVGYPYNPISFAPGVDMSTRAFLFFLNLGYRLQAASLHMEMDLRFFRLREKIRRFRKEHEKDGIIYRICDRQDVEALLRFMKTFPGWYDRVLAAVKSEIPKPVLIAKHMSNVVGFAGPIWVRNGEGHFTGIGVLPKYRRRKIGTVLFNLLCYELKKRGAVHMALHTGTSNPAQEIYFDAGFKVRSVWATRMIKVLQ